MGDIDLCYASISDLSRDFGTGALSPVEVTRAHLERIDRLNPVLEAYLTVLAESALADARRAEEEISRGEHRGPLHGVPIGLKDLVYTEGIRTTAGMSIHRNFIPAYDATVASRLRRAGAVLLGKLNLTEAAGGEYHPDSPAVVNPWNSSYWAGASSSGSAVATATGMCTASLGSDTGGSIRNPCNMNAVTGIKPTWGRVSVHGVFGMAPSLDVVGPIARSAEDAYHVLRAIAGPDVNDPTAGRAEVPDYSVGPPEMKGMRIGFDPEAAFDGVESAVVNVLRDALATFESLGAAICQVRLPSTMGLAAGWGAYAGTEAAVVHEETFPSRSTEYGRWMRELLGSAYAVSGIDIARIEDERRAFGGRFEAHFEDLDLVLLPVLPVGDLTLDRFTQLLYDSDNLPNVFRYTAPFNFSGNPTITLPGGFDGAGVPIGFQLVSRHLDELLLARAGSAFQSATDWHLRRPPV
ncbi:amidase [Rhodococcus spongiicola]|uniref:Amidase n=1 Tax=Rhodococcus spongiicola TaxID=2487352 RepID=A0A438ASA2_9NOCA|nr:amidase [Rhodococcus spongiicola]RVW01502.1 amidase [Rhodococcus spongiicola]